MKNATTTMLQVDENPSRAVSESLSFWSLLSIQFAVLRRCDAIVSEEMGVWSATRTSGRREGIPSELPVTRPECGDLHASVLSYVFISLIKNNAPPVRLMANSSQHAIRT